MPGSMWQPGCPGDKQVVGLSGWSPYPPPTHPHVQVSLRKPERSSRNCCCCCWIIWLIQMRRFQPASEPENMDMRLNEWEQLESCRAPAGAATSLITLSPRWQTILHPLCCLAWTQLTARFNNKGLSAQCKLIHAATYLVWCRDKRWQWKKERKKKLNLRWDGTHCPSPNIPPTSADLQLWQKGMTS